MKKVIILVAFICSFSLLCTDTVPLEFIAQFLPKDPIILEAGAHNGSDTIRFAQLIPGSFVYAFEPFPTVFSQLRQATRSLPNVQLFQLALSDQKGEAFFYASCGAFDASGSLLAPKEHLICFPQIHFAKIKVQTITLDEWAEANNVSHVDFMWLDMQGTEFQVLKASHRIIKTVRVIHTEVCLKELYEHCGMYAELRAFLENEGFVVMQEVMHFQEGWGDVLFVRHNSVMV